MTNAQFKRAVTKLHWRKVPAGLREKAKFLGVFISGYKIKKTGDVFFIFSEGKTPSITAIKDRYLQVMHERKVG